MSAIHTDERISENMLKHKHSEGEQLSQKRLEKGGTKHTQIKDWSLRLSYPEHRLELTKGFTTGFHPEKTLNISKGFPFQKRLKKGCACQSVYIINLLL
jgi:hypothetical protein